MKTMPLALLLCVLAICQVALSSIPMHSETFHFEGQKYAGDGDYLESGGAVTLVATVSGMPDMLDPPLFTISASGPPANAPVILTPPFGSSHTFTLTPNAYYCVGSQGALYQYEGGSSWLGGTVFCNYDSFFDGFAGESPNGVWTIAFQSGASFDENHVQISWALSESNCPPLLDDNNANWETTTVNAMSYGVCLSGYVGNPSRECQSTGTFSSTVNNPCVLISSISCAGPVNYANAQWGPSGYGPAPGTCNAGWTGSPFRMCQANGQWSSYVNPPCTPVPSTCAPQTNVDNADWPTGFANVVAHLSCVSGYYGTPTALCQSGGTWGPIQGSCQQDSATGCSGTTIHHAVFPPTPAGQTATGSCESNYQPFGGHPDPTRLCLLDGTWDVDIPAICVLKQCTGQTIDNATVGATVVGGFAHGTCTGGTTGSPVFQCQDDQTWTLFRGACTA